MLGACTLLPKDPKIVECAAVLSSPVQQSAPRVVKAEHSVPQRSWGWEQRSDGVQKRGYSVRNEGVLSLLWCSPCSDCRSAYVIELGCPGRSCGGSRSNVSTAPGQLFEISYRLNHY